MSRKVGRRSTKPDFKIVEQQVFALADGPQRKKKWTKHDVKSVQPLTENQKNMFVQYFQGDQLAALGSAGTGKSFLACYLGICDVIDNSKEQDKLIIVRSAVQARDVGFMPGTLEEKNAYYESPYEDIMAELFGRKATYSDMKEAGLVSFLTTSFIRGLTWDNAVIVIDEIQNMTWEEINTVMTRVGRDSRVILCGDVKQNDLIKKANDQSGIGRLIRTLEHVEGFSQVTFTRDDIVRSNFVKQWIIATEITE